MAARHLWIAIEEAEYAAAAAAAAIEKAEDNAEAAAREARLSQFKVAWQSWIVGREGGVAALAPLGPGLAGQQYLAVALDDDSAAPLHVSSDTASSYFSDGETEQLDALQTVHGHETLLQERGRYGSVQIIVADRAGRANGFSDPRRGGVAGRVGDPLPAPAHPSAPVRPVER